MKVIYHCFGGAHSSVTAAAIHLGWIESHRLPTLEELMKIPYFDKTEQNDYGIIRFMGLDEKGHEVYILGKRNLGWRLNNVLIGLADLTGKKDELMVVNCLAYVNWMMMLGGFMSRRLGLIFPGRPILYEGVKNSFMNLTSMVSTIKLKMV